MRTKKENIDLTQASSCICFNLRKTSRTITKIYDEALRVVNLRVTQFSILAFVYYYKNITITLLSNELAMDRTTLTRNLKPLERGKFIDIRKQEDPRYKTISLTSKGKEIFQNALPVWSQVQANVVQRIGLADADHLISELNRIRNTAR